MRQSQIFVKTQRYAPAEEEANNAKLLIRAGFINKEMAGVYSYLPLGLMTLRNIESVIREEMNAIGGQEVLMTTLQDPEVWKKSNRWVEEEVDASKGLPWFKTKLSKGGELGIANTHEEALANILRHHISSYKDLPKYIYQIQTKFRNELRAKSGILRGREFLMKDLYSFSKDEKEFRIFYEKCAETYMKIFSRVGLGGITYRTFASGGAFSKFSDEFQTISDVGEDTIYVDNKKNIAINKEVYTDEVINSLGLTRNSLIEKKSIEVGNIFPLGINYSKALGLSFKDENGASHNAFMGSYGIGISRLMGTIVEVNHDEKGLVWPEEVAPFKVHLIELKKGLGEKLYERLSRDQADLHHNGNKVFYDDRDIGAGDKFNDSDLIGIPYRAVVSEKTGGKIELKKRNETKTELITYEFLAKLLQERRD